MQQEIPRDKLSRVYSYDALGSIGIGVRLAVLAVRDVRTLERRATA